jgi:predicted RNase H-like HicB family nuclease
MTRDFRKQADNYLILVAGGPPTNYSAWSPDVLGCVATGDTIEECVAHMKEALAFHLEFLDEDGDPIPDGSGPGVYVAHTTRPAA